MHHPPPPSGPATLLHAALAYFGVVFAFAFVLGIVRTLLLAPMIGDMAAVLVELPIVLTISWIAAGRILRRWRLTGAKAWPRLAVGGLAFVFLMLAEFLLSRAIGQGGAAWAASLMTPPGMVGLAGQILFALIPLARPR